MALTLLALAFQLQIASGAGAPAAATARPDEDSLRDVRRAHEVQAGFERSRRNALPWAFGSGGRCDVRVGRFCWWYEDASVTTPPEPVEISRRRAALLAELDSLAQRRPGDPWITGIRVYYRVDNRQPAQADSAARECRARAWWCAALAAYAAHALGATAQADSGFAVAMAAMPDTVRCAWRNIAPLLPRGARDRYERQSCAERATMESRYWMLANPRLSTQANEWRAEFFGRRLVAALLASAVTPHPLSWGEDSGELLVRYGWPVAWTRTTPQSALTSTPEILGHDPSPSFPYGPREALLDPAATSWRDGWDMRDLHAESRYAHPSIRHVSDMAVQLARFRRGDSTLVTAAWAAAVDSLLAPRAVIGVVLDDESIRALATDSALVGRGRLIVSGAPRMAGVEVSDTSTGTLARARALFARRDTMPGMTMSDLLIYRPADETAAQLDEALERAIPGDTASVTHPIGLYWETYGGATADTANAPPETSVMVERIDRGFFRAARQRLGLLDPDSPVRIRWSEALGSGAQSSRAISLDLTELAAGRYRITVAVAAASGGAPATSTRELTLTDR